MSGKLARSAGLIGVVTLASRVLGMVRDVVQARYFATGFAADAFVVATRIPTLLRDLFAEGAMSAAFVPTFTRELERGGKANAWRLGSQVINALLIVTGLIVVLGMVFAEPLTQFYTRAEYQDIPGKLALTVQLTRINMPFLLLVAIAAACMGMLNALRRFFAPALSPAMYNVVFIICTIVGVPAFTAMGIPPVMALSVGMLLGGVAQIAVQWPSIRREGYRHAWTLDPKDAGLRDVLVLMGPGSLGAAAAQVNILVNTLLATEMPGAPSALSYAFRLMYLPVGIFGVSIATAAVPELARQAASGERDEMRRTLSWGMRLMLVITVPASIGMMVLATPIIELIYKGGAFRADSVFLVAQSLLFYAPGIVGYSLVKILSPGFYSLRDARTPVLVSVLTIGTNLALNLTLVRVLGFQGLALGTAIAANLNAALLFVLLSRRLGGLEGARVLAVFARVLAASVAMAAAAALADGWLAAHLSTTDLVARLARVAGGITVGIMTFAGAAWMLRLEEFRDALGRIFARFRASR